MAEEKTEQSSLKRRQRTKYPDLWIYPNGKIYLRFFKKGLGQVERSTETSSITKARQIADNMKAELLGIKKKSAIKQSLFGDLWLDYLNGIKGRRESTDKRDEQIGRQWLLPFFDNMRLHEIEDEWEAYIEDVHSKKPGLTIFSHRKTLLRFLNWAEQKKHLDKVPHLRNPDPKAKAGRVYSKPEIKALLETSKSLEYPDLYLHILMSITMGTRASENCSLSWDRVDLNKGIITLTPEVTKTKKGRKFEMSKEVALVLAERRSRNKNWVFPMPTDPSRHVKKDYFNKQWAKVKQTSSITNRARFHDLRHTFLTYAFKKTINPLLICDYAGLDIKVAQRVYLHFTPEDTRAVASPLGDLGLGEN